jgi:hypothetical protein
LAMFCSSPIFAMRMPAQQSGTPTFITFEAPGAGTSPYQGTAGTSINADGTTTGYYSDASNVYHGFVRDSSGT